MKKPEQFEALEAILADRNVLAILLTGFGKSLIYQGFCLAKQSTNPNECEGSGDFATQQNNGGTSRGIDQA